MSSLLRNIKSLVVELNNPAFFTHPHLQVICCYIARYKVKNYTRNRGGGKSYMPNKWGGGWVSVGVNKIDARNVYLYFFEKCLAASFT